MLIWLSQYSVPVSTVTNHSKLQSKDFKSPLPDKPESLLWPDEAYISDESRNSLQFCKTEADAQLYQ